MHWLLPLLVFFGLSACFIALPVFCAFILSSEISHEEESHE